MPPAPNAAARDLQAPGSSPNRLDGPPPTMALERAPAPPQTLADLVSPESAGAVAPQQIPAPILRGLVEAGTQIHTMLESFVQIVPQFSADFQIVALALERALAKVVEVGAPASSPTAPGPSFPAGGIGSAPMS